MKVGYVRVSTKEQNTDRQEIMMKELDVEKVFIDKASGKNDERPQLKEMMGFVRDGDTVVVDSFSRLARNTEDLLRITKTFRKNGVKFISKKEAIDTSTPMGRMYLTVTAAIDEMNREIILEYQKEGIAAAKAAGKHLGRKRKVTMKKFRKEYADVVNGKRTKAQLARDLFISDSTFRYYEQEMLEHDKNKGATQ